MVEFNPKIYVVSPDSKSYVGSEDRLVLHYFYLDGKAEKVNGYDICEGNLAAHNLCLGARVFEATLVFADGREEPCTVSSFFDEEMRRMRGYVWLTADEDAQPFINQHRERNEKYGY